MLPADLPSTLTRLAEQVIARLNAIIAALVAQNPDAAERICTADAQIDDSYQQIAADLIDRIEHDGRVSHWVAGLLLVAY
jgi:phosphate uptake regulator